MCPKETILLGQYTALTSKLGEAAREVEKIEVFSLTSVGAITAWALVNLKLFCSQSSILWLVFLLPLAIGVTYSFRWAMQRFYVKQLASYIARIECQLNGTAEDKEIEGWEAW